ncbi:MAG TPA: glucose-6-phosphate dehydrogenase, partial [Gemmatimonadaceae bacterium]|nr:glucose-6-phosphate dehydrogenase [Gemmatimonadaceae bacterium]
MASSLTAGYELGRRAPTHRELRRAGPCTVIIMGASGDLTSRKLMPALAHLDGDGLLDAGFAAIGVSREGIGDEAFRRIMDHAIQNSTETGELEAAARERFLERLHFVSGDLRDAATYTRVGECLAEIEGDDVAKRGRLFYLAIPPSLYPDVLKHLSASGLAPRASEARSKWVRLIIEKPFGHDLESARQLNKLVRGIFSERQIYRIDHYLGKETVQNLLVLRFANSIFEPIWNREHVHHIQITAAETVGVEHRAAYYEEAGVLRDMFQNHLLQLLSLTTMEPPSSFDADMVRDEKVKALRSIRPLTKMEARTASVVGQYGPGVVNGQHVPGYREEPGVAPDSRVPTYAALRLMIDNWRWEGVPFFLRSGKRMAERVTEIAVQFRRPPHLLFPVDDDDEVQPNVLVIRIQPDEAISLSFEVKVPGVEVRLTPVRMVFSYPLAFGASTHSAYETLLLDAMHGDAMLFARADQVEAAWKVMDP